jgi:hypothetical protein
MAKTKAQIAAYNKEYFARPEVKERAKIRNAQYRKRRAEYKKTEAGRVAEKRYRQTTRVKSAYRNRLKTRYGLTPEEVEQMKLDQNGMCGICIREPKTWHIDHCHQTGKVRGMLCGSCNMALGLLKDSERRIINAAIYLRKSRGVQ